MLKKDFQQLLKNKLLPIILIVIGSALWSLTMVRSGLCWNTGCSGGLGFWGANGHDGIWHISLINSLSKGNFQMPIFAGQDIKNYHIGFDFLISLIVKITRINSSLLYFQLIPPILSLLIGFLTYKFVYLWKKSDKEAWWSTFFVYFGGSFGWLVSLIRGQGWGGESMFWSQQSISTLINPPFALSLIVILSGLIFLQKYFSDRKNIYFIIAFFLFGISIFIKVYAGLLVLSALFLASMWNLIVKKDLKLFLGFLVSLILSLLLFLPFNKSSSNLITYAPFWFLESMMALSDRVGWQRMYSAMTTYRMGHIWVKAVLAYSVVFAIFIIGNFGTRIISIFSIFQKRIKIFSINVISIILVTIISAGIIVPMFFVQIGVPWNTIQFFYYTLIFSGIIAGISFAQILEKLNSKFVKNIIILAIIAVTIPTTTSSLKNYLSIKPHSIISKSEMEALNYLKNQPEGTVLTYPYYAQNQNTLVHPTPMYLYTTTAYVSAYSGKSVFIEDQTNLVITQYPWEERRASVENFLNTLDISSARKFLKDNNIKYIYWLKGQYARIGDSQLGLTEIFKNSDATIYVIN